MERTTSFIDNNIEVVLPVTPSEYEGIRGKNIETTSINNLGDFAISGGAALSNMAVSGMFPAQRYSFVHNEWHEPQYYIDIFKEWAISNTIVHYIVHGTDINMPVLVEDFTYSETDGSNDVYFSIKLVEYRQTEIVEAAGWTIPKPDPNTTNSGDGNSNGNGNSNNNDGGSQNQAGGGDSGGGSGGGSTHVPPQQLIY
ncbi:MAG: hypothetical protein RR389_01080 [Christensenella sp.]